MKAPDRIDAARQVLGQVLTHPATWAPFLPVAAAYAFIGVPWWACLPLLLATALMVCVVWGRYWPRLIERAHAEQWTAQCTAENAELGERMERVAQMAQRRPMAGLLETVREAMGIKEAVDNRLHADGTINPHEDEVRAMIASLVRKMVDEAERLALAEGGEVSRTATERFNKAAATLRRTYAEIDVILDPVPEDMRLAAGDDALARASERLDEKLEQARGVRRHLERDMKIPEADWQDGTAISTDSAPTPPSVEK